MWISRLAFVAQQEVLTSLDAQRDQLQRDLQIEQLKVTLLERQLATAQANVDWLRVFCNTLSQDRAAIAAAKGIELPAPVIEGALQTAAAVKARAAAVAAGGGPPVEIGQALSGIEAAADVDDALKAYGDSVHNFEDVGDAEAQRLGVQHNETDGTVEYTR